MTRTQAFFILLGAVNSDLSFLADVANQERIREYDYGPGAGGALELYLLRKNFPLLVAKYRGSYINVSNGSIYNNDTADIGLESSHGVQQAYAQAGDSDREGLRDRGGRVAVLPPQPLRLRRQRRAARDRHRAPHDHPAQPGSAGVPDLELQPLGRATRGPRCRG